MDKVVLTIERNSPDVVLMEIHETVGGLKKETRKRLSYGDFVASIVNSSEKVDRVRIGMLPSGFYDGVLDVDGKGWKCLIVLPEGIKPFIYYDQIFHIPFPTLLFSVEVCRGIHLNSSVFALASDKVTMDSKLYRYPFGNVNGNGVICWGMNVIDNINSLRQTEVVISTFFGCSTNDDYYWSEKISVPAGDSRRMQRGLVESLQNQDKFPSEILVPTGMTVGRLIKGWGVD